MKFLVIINILKTPIEMNVGVLVLVVLLIYLVFLLLLWQQRKLSKRLKKETSQHQFDLALMRNKVHLAATALADEVLSSSAEFKLNDSDWDDFIELVNNYHHGFVAQLLSKYPSLNKGDVQICCLTKQGFSNQVIANLMNQQSASYARRKSRIKQEKMNGLNDERSFEEIINGIG